MHPATQSPPMWISEAVAGALFAVFVACIVGICVGLS